MGFFKSLFSAIEKSISQEMFSKGMSTSSGVSQSGATTGGDVDVKSITLMSEDRTRMASIFPQVKMIHIYENISQPVITAVLEIEDMINLHEKFPIIGEEYVAIELQTPGTERSSRYFFRVKRRSELSITENNKGVRYTLVCYSPEYQAGVSSLIQDAPEQEPHKTVKDIMLDTIKTTKRVRVDETKGTPQKQLSNLPPLVAIDLLRRSAKSKNTNALGGAWFFFENADGFNFTTLDKMYERGKKNQKSGSDKVFFYDVTSGMSPLSVNARNILMFKQVSFADNMDAQQEGMYRASYAGFDLTKGVTEKYDFKSSDFDTPAGTRNTTQFRANREQSTSVAEIVPFRSELNSTDEDAEAVAKRNAFVQQMVQSVARITVYGDTYLTVGDVIDCNITEARDTTEDPKKSRFSSGKYLISKIKHTIQLSDRNIHVMTMELIKGSVIEEAK